MSARPRLWSALALLGLSFAAGARAQESPPSPPPEEPLSQLPAAPGEPIAQEPPVPEEPREERTGPTPGAPTLTLAQAVALALERNFGILSAADGVQAAEHRLGAARADFHPTLTPRYLRNADGTSITADASQRLPWSGGSLTASATLRSTPLQEPITSHTTDLRVILSQPLMRGFGPNATYFNLTSSRRGRESQERSLELARQRLVIQVTAAFYGVVAQRQLLEVARQSRLRSDNLARASEARLKIGLVSKLDVFRAELQASQAQEAQVRTRAALESTLEQFRALLALPPSDPVEPEAAPLPETLPAETDPLEVLVTRARESRLDLREVRDQVEDARRSASLARQNLLPQLDLNMGYTRSGFGTTFSNAFDAGDRRFDVFLSASYPFQRSTDKANRAVAELDLLAKERAVRQKEQEVETEVRAAVRELERIRQSVELQRKGVEVAAQQRRLAILRYQRGLASNFDVVDAEGSLVLARSALVGLLTTYKVAQVELLRATGALDVTRELAP